MGLLEPTQHLLAEGRIDPEQVVSLLQPIEHCSKK